MYFCGIQLKRDISVTIHHLILFIYLFIYFLFFLFFISMDVTLKESESYFLAFYLQGENSFKEDKDYDFYFVDPFLVDPLKVIVLVPVHFAFEPTSEPVFELVPEPKSSPTEPTGN